MRVVADCTIPYLKGILEPYAEVCYLNSSQFTPENIRGADVLIVRSIDRCDRSLLEGNQVKLITTATIGYDHIDINYCNQQGIIWKNAPGCNAASVGQYIFSSLLLLSIKKGIHLQDKTIGIVGVGHVGKEVEKLCAAYGMHILRNDPPRAAREGNDSFVSLDELAEEADIITFHTPLTKEGAYPTYHLANKVFFDKCKRKPWFVNAARGSVHDTAALLKAYENGIISELILDCWENEPFINSELLNCTSIATPHIAGFSADGKSNATRMCVEYISSFYHLGIKDPDKIVPAAPENPVIDLNRFTGLRFENAFLQTFNPESISQELYNKPEKFEWFRSHYNHPREPKAYVITNASEKEKEIAHTMGFKTSL